MKKYISLITSTLCIALLMIGTSNAADVNSKQKIDTNFLNQGQILLRKHYLFIGGKNLLVLPHSP